MARYKITKDTKALTVRVAFMIVREPMRFLHKPLKEKLEEWKLNRVETLVALWELKQMLEKDWFIERMHLARMMLQQHNILVRHEEKLLKKESELIHGP
jgi:hypothetical protein